MKELRLPATRENLEPVLAFLDAFLQELDCPLPIQFQLDVAVEEIYVNIASYAYAPAQGEAVLRCRAAGSPCRVWVELRDWGRPYDPLSRADPDVTLSAQERGIGGLGIYMVKKSMDAVQYRYEDGQNILTLEKCLAEEM